MNYYLCTAEMAELELNTDGLSKEEKYETLITQIPALLDPKVDWVANVSNFNAALKEVFGWLWIGVYRKVSEDYLQLGPFQGPVACTFIQKGKGVCGQTWLQDQAIVVEDVDKFPGHIACSSLSKSEIVLPLYKEGVFWGVLDIDSTELSTFSDEDLEYLSQLTSTLEKFL